MSGIVPLSKEPVMSHKTLPELIPIQLAQRRPGSQGAPDGAAEQIRRVAEAISAFGFIGVCWVDAHGRITPSKVR